MRAHAHGTLSVFVCVQLHTYIHNKYLHLPHPLVKCSLFKYLMIHCSFCTTASASAAAGDGDAAAATTTAVYGYGLFCIYTMQR